SNGFRSSCPPTKPPTNRIRVATSAMASAISSTVVWPPSISRDLSRPIRLEAPPTRMNPSTSNIRATCYYLSINFGYSDWCRPGPNLLLSVGLIYEVRKQNHLGAGVQRTRPDPDREYIFANKDGAGGEQHDFSHSALRS